MSQGRTRKIPPNVHIFKLTFSFFVLAMVIFIIAMVKGIWDIPEMIRAQTVRHTAGLTLAHLFVLGWATMIAMGASFQLTQVILRTPLYSKRLGYIHFALYTAGFLMIVLGFSFGGMRAVALGGLMLIGGVILYAYNLLVTFIRKKEMNPFHFGVSLSLFHLLLAVWFGFLMGASVAFSWMPMDYRTMLSAHIWFGVVGWLSGLIITYSFKLLPMFYSSPRRAVKEAYLILTLFHLGVWSKAFFFWNEWLFLQYAAYILILASAVLFIRFVYQVRAQSRRKQSEGAVRVALYLIPATAFVALCWMVAISFIPDQVSSLPVTEAMVLFLILGWFSPTILSYLSKIVPFLWWAQQFHSSWNKKSKVMLSDMAPEKKMTFVLFLYLAGISFVCTGFLFSIPLLAAIGQMIAVGMVVLYLIDLIRVFSY